jgi:hypothetical protein
MPTRDKLTGGTTIGGYVAYHKGNLLAADIQALGISPVITLAGDLTGSVTLTNLASGTLTATIAANSVALGTDTTGNYIATLANAANGGLTVTGSGSENAAVTIGHSNVITASNTGPSANSSPGYGGTFTVPYLVYDVNGHITSTANRTITLPASDNTDTNTYPTAFAWSDGTTAGPTGSLTGTSPTVSFGAIPSASATTSGIVTTGTQTFAGAKTFTAGTIDFASGVANTALIRIRTDQAGSPQITMTDNFGDMTWAIGGDDGDNSFKIHGTANSTESIINNMAAPFFEISTGGNTVTRTGMMYAEAGIGRLPANWDGAVTDIAGTDLIISGGRGTGTGTPGKILLQTPTATTTGTTTQSLTTRVTIDHTNTTIANNLIVSGDLMVNGTTTNLSTGALTVTGSISSGATNMGGYRAGGDNIILKGNSTGISGIFFESEKDGTNINHPSDYGFLQFHAYGIDGTSGESNRLVLGVANDSTDKVVLQTPYNNGLVTVYQDATSGTGFTERPIYHSGNSNLSTVNWAAQNLSLTGSVSFNDVSRYWLNTSTN